MYSDGVGRSSFQKKPPYKSNFWEKKEKEKRKGRTGDGNGIWRLFWGIGGEKGKRTS